MMRPAEMADSCRHRTSDMHPDECYSCVWCFGQMSGCGKTKSLQQAPCVPEQNLELRNTALLGDMWFTRSLELTTDGAWSLHK